MGDRREVGARGRLRRVSSRRPLHPSRTGGVNEFLAALRGKEDRRGDRRPIQFRHPAVVSVIAGAQRASEVRRNAAMMRTKPPAALWRALKAEKLLREDAPTPR